jgi:carbonic anhydrase
MLAGAGQHGFRAAGASMLMCGGSEARQGMIRPHLKYVDPEVLEEDGQRRLDRMCELNVMEQVYNVCYTPMVQEAWSRGQELAVHGVIYRLSDGLLQDLKTCVAGTNEIDSCYRIVPSVTMAAR